jgi:hypothetical protein
LSHIEVTLNIIFHITTKSKKNHLKSMKHHAAWHSLYKPTCKFLGKLNPKSEVAQIFSPRTSIGHPKKK